MISLALKALLDAIRAHEGKTYGQIFYGAKGVPRDTDVSKLTLIGVLSLQQRMLNNKSLSTACGGYQFLRKTLQATIIEMNLTGSELWDEALQDRMAVHLMEGRGLAKYLAGQISREAFANNLAKEWASLPVVTAIRGANRQLQPGETYYAGDGLNKAFHKPEAILALLDALRRAPQPAPQPAAHNGAIAAPLSMAPSAPPPVVAAKVAWWRRLMGWG